MICRAVPRPFFVLCFWFGGIIGRCAFFFRDGRVAARFSFFVVVGTQFCFALCFGGARAFITGGAGGGGEQRQRPRPTATEPAVYERNLIGPLRFRFVFFKIYIPGDGDDTGWRFPHAWSGNTTFDRVAKRTGSIQVYRCLVLTNRKSRVRGVAVARREARFFLFLFFSTASGNYEKKKKLLVMGVSKGVLVRREEL